MSSEKKSQSFYQDALISKTNQDSSFRAVKNLVEAENHIETVKNRIKVLQINEQRNINKINIQKALIDKITQTRNQHLLQLKKLGVNKMQRERLKNQIRQKNQQFRQNHKQKMTTIKEQIFQEKYKEYSNIVEQRELNQSVILEHKINSLHQNQQKRNTVAQNQQKSKENIVRFYDDKTKSIYQRNMTEIKKINNSRMKKQKKLNEYASIEMELVQRHSQSQVAYQEMKSKLDSMLGKIRNQKRKGQKQMKSFLQRSQKENIYNLQNP